MTAADAGPCPPSDRPRVAFQGELGAFSEEAVRAFFGDVALPLPCHEFRDVCDAVSAGDAVYGVLPVENTIVGRVTAADTVLSSLALEVVGEVTRPIRQCLLGTPGATLADVQRVISHPVALGQCTRFLATNPHLHAVAVRDTAGAARAVACAADPSLAAIAGQDAARRYGLAILAANIQDLPDNRTRFVVVRRADRGGAGVGTA